MVATTSKSLREALILAMVPDPHAPLVLHWLGTSFDGMAQEAWWWVANLYNLPGPWQVERTATRYDIDERGVFDFVANRPVFAVVTGRSFFRKNELQALDSLRLHPARERLLSERARTQFRRVR